LTHRFRSGTDFAEVLKLYALGRELRLLAPSGTHLDWRMSLFGKWLDSRLVAGKMSAE